MENRNTICIYILYPKHTQTTKRVRQPTASRKDENASTEQHIAEIHAYYEANATTDCVELGPKCVDVVADWSENCTCPKQSDPVTQNK